MSVKSFSTLSEVSGLNSVVKHLQDLALRLGHPDSFVKQSDADAICRVVDSIQELVEECYRLHEKLEKETIHASILRHKLRFFPEEIQQEIQRAVDAARDLNLSELNRLQKQSQDIDAEIIFLDNRLLELNTDNEIQKPERDRIHVIYDDYVTQLNDRMSTKASMQIHLNETRDRIRDTNEKIADLEDGILELKEDLIQERADARNEKKNLQTAIEDTTKRLKDQQGITAIKKLETDKLYDKMTDLQLKLDDLKGGTVASQVSCNELEAREALLSKKLEKLDQQNEILRGSTSLMTKQLAVDERAFDKRITELRNRICELDRTTVSENKKTEDLKEESQTLEIVLKERLKVMEADDLRVRQRNAILQGQKRILGSKQEEIARLLQEISGMERGMIDLGHTHRCLMDTIRTQVDECRKNLAKERQERMVLDDVVQKLEKEMEDFRRETSTVLSRNQKMILEGKKEYERKMQESTRLQVLIKDGRAEVVTLEQDLVVASDDLDEIMQEKSVQVASMKTEIEKLEQESLAAKDLIEREMPQFRELEKEFHDKRESFEQTKKDFVASKSTVKKLEEAIRHTRMDVHSNTKPQEGLQRELDKGLKESLALLQGNIDRLQNLEKEIYATDLQVARLKSENDRFIEGNSQQESDLAEVDKQMLCNEELSRKLEEELENLRAQVLEIWTKESEIQEEVEKRDHATVAEFGQLLSQTNDREDVVSDIALRLQSELSLLSEFLGQVSRRRPKSTAKKENRVKQPTPRDPSSARENMSTSRDSPTKVTTKVATKVTTKVATKVTTKVH